MSEEGDCCTNGTCGCHMDIFPTTIECPICGKHLRLIGRSQLFEFRLSCPNCGHQSAQLPQEEVLELL